jgi:hypothetical protein
MENQLWTWCMTGKCSTTELQAPIHPSSPYKYTNPIKGPPSCII